MKETTNIQIDLRLAEFMGVKLYFNPSMNLYDLRDVLRKLTPEQWVELRLKLSHIWEQTNPGISLMWWLLTCDPAIIARAVAEVVG